MKNRISELIDKMAESAAKMSPEAKASCAELAKKDVREEQLSPLFEAIFDRLHGKAISPIGGDVQKLSQELQERDQNENTRRAALTAPMHLFFFTAVDRNGVIRFFDIMQGKDIFSVAESATTAPRLAQCTETVYGVPGNGALHHVHRLYGSYPMVHVTSARAAMNTFAKAYSLTQIIEKAETFNQLQAQPTWKDIFQKLGCPVGGFFFKNTTEFIE
jgi:hypothetical protein